MPRTPVAETTAARAVSLEERLGQNWLNKLGIVALVIGLSLFLGREIHHLNALGKSALGMLLSLTLLGGGLLLERRPRYRLFARAAIGGGWALTFFVTFALYHVDAMRVLPSQGVDLVLMMGVAAAMVGHSLKYKSQVVSSLACLLAIVTVGISEVTLFSLVAGALLAVGLIYVAARERWFGLGLAGLVGVYLNHFLWLHRVLPEAGQPGRPFAEFLPSVGLLLLYWLLFRLLYVLRVPQTREQGLVSSLTAVLNSAGLLALLKYQSAHPEWAFGALLALGAAELALALLARRTWRGAFVVLSSLASLLLLAAIPFRFGGSSWSLVWLLQAEMLFVAGLRMREVVFRRLGLAAGLAAFVQLAVTGVLPVLNLRAAGPDAATHLPVAIALLCAAALFWFNAEVAPRRWEALKTEDGELDSAASGLTSCLALAAMGLGLWVWVPVAWTAIAWLGVALGLGWVSDRTASRRLAMQSDLIALAAVCRAAMVNLSLTGHWGWLTVRALTVTLAAALLYAGMRRRTRATGLDGAYVPGAYSWAAAGLLTALLWLELPMAGVAVALAGFALALGWVADWMDSSDFATQSDGLALLAVARACSMNLFADGEWHGVSLRALTMGGVAALLYLTTRRRTRLYGAESDYVPAVYSWTATALLALVLALEVQPAYLALGWSVFGLALFELGLAVRRGFLRHQGYALLAASFVRLGFESFAAGDGGRTVLYGVLPPTVAYLWTYERLHRRDAEAGLTAFDRSASVAAAWAGGIAAAALLYRELAPQWLPVAWAGLALVLLAAGSALRRKLWVGQSLAMLAVTAVRILGLDLFSATAPGAALFASRAFSVGAACGAMLLALPFAFRVRKQYAAEGQAHPDDWRASTLYRPEQPFFFVPLALLTALAAVELHAGMMTIGLGALGLLAFLFAVTVGERSYRLAGLSLLMLGVAKIVLVDIWSASRTDQYVTLIAMGAALMLVSFLYSRYKETILKLL